MSGATPIEDRRAANRRTLRANRIVLVLMGVVMLVLGVGMVVGQWPRTDRELEARTSGPVVEVVAQDTECPEEGPCRSFWEAAPDEPVGAFALSSDRVRPGTRRLVHKDPLGNTYFVGSSCCRDDLAFALGGAFAAWGLATVLTVVVPVRRRSAGTVGLNLPGRMLPAILALPAGVVTAVAIQLLDVQPSSVAQAAGLGSGVPLVVGLLAVAATWWRRSITATVGSLTIRRAWGTETVALGPSTSVDIVPDHDGSAALVRLDDGTTRSAVRVVRWGELDRFSGELHRVLTLSGTPVEGDDLARLLLPPSVPAARFVLGPALAGR